MTNLTYRERCTLVLLEKFADKIFDEKFKREAWDAGLEVHQLLANHITDLTDEMCRSVH